MNDHSSLHQLDRDAEQLSALAHPVRLEILRHLTHRHACCVKDLVDRSHLAQSTISQHLKKLVEANLVQYKREQQRSAYQLNRAEFSKMSERLAQLLGSCGQCEASTQDISNLQENPNLVEQPRPYE